MQKLKDLQDFKDVGLKSLKFGSEILVSKKFCVKRILNCKKYVVKSFGSKILVRTGVTLMSVN